LHGPSEIPTAPARSIPALVTQLPRLLPRPAPGAPDRLFGGRYAVLAQIGEGSFGKIYRGEDIKTHAPVAIKVEELTSSTPQLGNESAVYARLGGCVNAAPLFYFGTEVQTCALVIGFLEHSLSALVARCVRCSLKTVLMLADQMISALEYLHATGFVHGDVKPDNFMMGGSRVFLIDFGLARPFRDARTGAHLPYAENQPFAGTPCFASASALRGNAVSRRDDMESLAYVWLFLLTGRLPWAPPGGPPHERYARMAIAKLRSPPDLLFSRDGKAFADYLTMVRRLRFADVPQYAAYRRMFREVLMSKQWLYDYRYDWCEQAAERRGRRRFSLKGAPRPPAHADDRVL
jgi:serine/threonine protein kinase